MKFKLEVEATDEEIKVFATDVLRRASLNVIRDAVAHADPIVEAVVKAAEPLIAYAKSVVQAQPEPAGDPPPPAQTAIPQPAGPAPAPQLRVEPEVMPPQPWVCGFKLRDDTLQGDPWPPCSDPVEQVVKHHAFGNRGRIARLCCAAHHDFLVRADPQGFQVTRVAGPFPKQSKPDPLQDEG